MSETLGNWLFPTVDDPVFQWEFGLNDPVCLVCGVRVQQGYLSRHELWHVGTGTV